MLEHIKVEIKPEMIIAAVNRMTKKERESFLEDLLASTAPDYLASIKEASLNWLNLISRLKKQDPIINQVECGTMGRFFAREFYACIHQQGIQRYTETGPKVKK